MRQQQWQQQQQLQRNLVNMAWMLLVLLYGIFKGGREIAKKKAMEKSTMMEVLFFYTLLSFLFVSPEIINMEPVALPVMGFIAIKSFIIFLAWIFGFIAVKKMPVSVYGVLDLSRVIFSTLLGIIVLSEPVRVSSTVGLIFVLTGLLMLKYRPGRKKKDSGEKVEMKYVLISFACCFLNALSALLDKKLMGGGYVSAGTLQFWYMLFLTLFYLIYILIRRIHLDFKGVIKNYWILLLSLMFVIADRALFLANAMPGSTMTVMTLIKQSGSVVTILGGYFVFKEKDIRYKLVCAGVVIAGICICTMFK